jgi:hypothetical protein
MRTVFAIVAALLISACKKDRVCECTLSVYGVSNEPGFVFSEPPPKTTTTTFEHVSSDHPALEAACATYEKREEIPYYSSNSGTQKQYTLVRTTRNQCFIK